LFELQSGFEVSLRSVLLLNDFCCFAVKFYKVDACGKRLKVECGLFFGSAESADLLFWGLSRVNP
jgi:hypothetical protein